MKLIRFGEPGREKPGVILEDSARLDVSSLTREFDEAFFADGGLSRLQLWLKENATSAPASCPVCPAGTTGRQAQQDRLHWVELSRPCQRKQHGDPERASHIFQGHHLSRRAER
jgi:hypothetical protein